MAATETRSVAGATVTLVTPEREPLWIFGDTAGAELRELLAERGVALRTAARAAHVTDDVLWLESGDAVIGDTVISLPRLVGPGIPGLPSDARRLPADGRARLRDEASSGCSRPATPRPSRSSRAASRPSRPTPPQPPSPTELGAAVEPRPFAPVLRGLAADRRGAALPAGRARLPRADRRSGAARRRRLTGEVSSRRCGGRPARSPAATSRRTSRPLGPLSLGDEPLVDRAPGAGGGRSGRPRRGARPRPAARRRGRRGR